MKACSLVKYSAGVVILFCIILLALHSANIVVFPGFNSNGNTDSNVTIPPKREDVPVPRKTILLWNSDWSDWSSFGAGHNAFIEAKCPVSVRNAAQTNHKYRSWADLFYLDSILGLQDRYQFDPVLGKGRRFRLRVIGIV